MAWPHKGIYRSADTYTLHTVVFIYPDIHPKDGNCIVCRNFGRVSTNNADETRKPVWTA
jgi:hypothetical protein